MGTNDTHTHLGLSLIVGGQGFVGTALMNELVASGAPVRITSRNDTTSCTVSQGVEVCVGDLRDEAFCTSIVAGVSTVYYVAGYKKNLKAHEESPLEFIIGNCDPFISFIKAALSSSVERIVYLSSVQAGSLREGEKNGYAIGKYLNERILTLFLEQQPGRITIVQAPGIYGPGDNFGAGANIIPSLIERIKKSPGAVTVWGTGERKMQFIYIDDLVQNVLRASQVSVSFLKVGNPEVVRVRDIVEYVQHALETSHEVVYDSTMPDAPSSVNVFQNLIVPEVSLREGIRRTTIFYEKLNSTHV